MIIRRAVYMRVKTKKLLLTMVFITVATSSLCQKTVFASGKHTTIQLPRSKAIINNNFDITQNHHFVLYDTDPTVSISVSIEHFPNNSGQSTLKKRISEIRKANKYFYQLENKKITIGNNSAQLVHLEYCRDGYSPCNSEQYVLIYTSTESVLICATSSPNDMENNMAIWESMYNSFSFEHSKAYKLPYGSFSPPKSMRDQSFINCRLPEGRSFSINIYNREPYPKTEMFSDSLLLRIYCVIRFWRPFNKSYGSKKKTYTINGRKAYYTESYKIDNFRTKYDVDAQLYVPDDRYSLTITISSSKMSTFDYYRKDMDLLFKSVLESWDD